MDAQNILRFLAELNINNNREWFIDHKDWYLACKDDYIQFVTEWLEQMKHIEPDLRGLQAKDCIWRIYRDLRFEKNRMCPYKEWMGAWLAPYGGRKSDHAGYYLHLQPGECMFAAGMWCPEGALLKQIRQDIYDNPEELEAIFSNPEFAALFPDFDHEPEELKTAPAGYPRDWEHSDWLRHKRYNISYPLTDEQVAAPDFMERLMYLCKTAKPLNDFLNYCFESL